MRLLYSIAVGAGLFIFFCASTAFSEDSWESWQARSGPVLLVNQSPIQLLFLQPMPDRAETLPKGHGSIRLDTTITNTLLFQTSDRYAGTIDMETIRASLEVNYGVVTGLELGISIPAVHYYSGFMDKPIREVEKMFSALRAVREDEEANQFNYSVEKDGGEFISASKNSTGIGDLVLRVKATVWEEGDTMPGLSGRVAVKLPTGDKDRAFGSGEVDWGVGVLLQKDIKKMTVYLNADVTFPGDAFDDVGVSLRKFYGLMVGAEYRFTSRFSALAQLNWTTRPFENTDLDMLDRRIIDILVGVTYYTENGIFIRIGGVEDIICSTEAGADVTLFLNAGINF